MTNAPRAILPSELAERLRAGDQLVLLDVRQPGELEVCVLPNVTQIPLADLSARFNELDPEAEIVCICHHGIRSANAAAGLHGLGFESLWNLTGGMDRWALDVDPSMPRY